MAAKFPETLTEQTLPAAWEWADRKRCRGKRASRAFHTASGAAQTVFALILLLPTLILLDAHGDATTHFLLGKFPQIPALWQTIQDICFETAHTPVQNALIWAALLYGIPLAVGLVFTAMVYLFYVPRRGKLETREPVWFQARQLQQALQEAQALSKGCRIRSIGLSNVLFAATVCGLLFFSFYAPPDGALRTGLTTGGMFHFSHIDFVGVPLMCIGVLFLIFAYWVASLPLLLLLKLITLCPVPQKTLEEAGRWFRHCEREASAQAAPVSQPPEEKV